MKGTNLLQGTQPILNRKKSILVMLVQENKEVPFKPADLEIDSDEIDNISEEVNNDEHAEIKQSEEPNKATEIFLGSSDSNLNAKVNFNFKNEAVDLSNLNSTELTPYQLLQSRREKIRELFKMFKSGMKSGVWLCYIDSEWLEKFLDYAFDKSDWEISSKIGPVATSTTDSVLPQSYIHPEIFKTLVDWYGIIQDHQLIQREVVFNKEENALQIDYSPLTISPHILCNNASHVNRYVQLRPKDFFISSHSTIAELRESFIKQFGLESMKKSVRLWQVSFNVRNVPPVLAPSALKAISQRSLISLIKKSINKTLKEKNIYSGDILLEIKQSDGSFLMDLDSHVLPGNGLVGLNNLGNTCYMNSALQCLAHIPELTNYFLYRYFENEINKDNPLGNNGKVALAFGNLIKNLFDRRYSGSQSSFSPRDFKYTIGYFNSLFADYHQQDSQEFIAFLLDGLHEDLNRVLKKPYVEKPELSPGRETNSDEIRKLASQCWDAHKLRNNSVIVDLFVALYKSTLKCPICDRISITFDPYNDLTLPLPISKKWSHKINILLENGRPQSIEVQLTKSSTYTDLKDYLSKKLCIPNNELFGFEIYKSFTYKNFEGNNSDSRYLPLSELIEGHDEIWFYQIKHKKDDLVVPVYSTVANTNEYKYINIFAIPFFITLSSEETKSYGTIRQKIERKYKQLSTSSIFEKLDQKQPGKYDISDFPNIELFFEFHHVKYEGDVDDESIISLSDPNYASDELFTIKVLDSNNEVGYLRKSKFDYLRTKNTESANEVLNNDFWVPENSNSITKSTLPELWNALDPVKRSLYQYNPERVQLLMQRKQQLNSEAEKKRTEEDIYGADDAKLNEENEEDEFDENNKNNDNNDDTKGKCHALESLSMMDGSIFESDGNDNNDVEMINLLSGDEEGREDEGKGSKNEMNEIEENYKQQTPNLSSSSEVSNILLEDEEEEIITKEFPKSEIILPLIGAKNALVCEWKYDMFDTCFCNMEDEENMGGTETFTRPEPLINEELEKERKLNSEKSKKSITLYDCLDLFSKPEILGQNDLWYCPSCKEHRQATKKIELWSVPDILTIHLKRFENTRSFSDKIDVVVDFPIQGLELTKYVADSELGEQLVYDLFAVDNHFGGLGGGHYTSYVKNFVDNEWYYFDDSRVSSVNDPIESVKGSAYLLFYRRRSDKPLGGEYFVQIFAEIEEQRKELEIKMEKLKEEEKEMMTKSEVGENNGLDGEMINSIMEVSEDDSRKSDDISSSGSLSYVSKNTADLILDDDGNKRRKVELMSPSSEPTEIELEANTYNDNEEDVVSTCSNSLNVPVNSELNDDTLDIANI